MELELLKEIPGYNAILKSVIKTQIQLLVSTLSLSLTSPAHHTQALPPAIPRFQEDVSDDGIRADERDTRIQCHLKICDQDTDTAAGELSPSTVSYTSPSQLPYPDSRTRSQMMELELLKEIPGYNAILKSVIKTQIQLLVSTLSLSLTSPAHRTQAPPTCHTQIPGRCLR